MEAVETKRIGKYEIEIIQDSDPKSPREWDNLGTMICFHKRYDLGDKHDYCHGNYEDWEEMKEAIIENENVHTILPLYLYDHSGITMNTTGFSCNWDSGQVGWIYISKDKVKKEGIDETKVADYLREEVKTYDQYLTGDVYGFKTYEISTCDHGHEHREEIDSCWGYYGEDSCMEEAEDIVNSLIKHDQDVEQTRYP
jgi:hypothetical protein